MKLFKLLIKFLSNKCEHQSRDIIFVYPKGDWEAPLTGGGPEVRLVDYKVKCKDCGEVFIDRDRWEPKNQDTYWRN